MKKFIVSTLAVAFMAQSVLSGGIVYSGEITIPAGVTNATASVVLGGADKIDAFALDRVFVATQATTYTGSVAVAMSDAGYQTSLGSGSAVLSTAPLVLYPRRNVIEYVNASSFDATNGVSGFTSTLTTNSVPYMVKQIDFAITVNGGSKTADRQVNYAIYAE